MTENTINLDNCVGVCTDGVRAMSEQYRGLQALIKTKAASVKWTHFVIYRKALAAKNVTPKCEHTSLIYYCNSRWLSKANVLARVLRIKK
ncbi:zinc finger BED domain-containing protein 5-like [Diabrotica undecimpunctata]|uniref:zinc finger BED domain-containing protein 5-like n=1 Tax=Diabrotica undecimpunctata TaxID=50387 RepID=UPI003B636D32